MARFKFPVGGGGGGNAGAWNILTPSDLQTDAQAFQSFTLSASSQAGFDNRIEMVANTTGSFNNFFRDNVGVVYFDTGFSVDDLDNGDKNSAVIQVVWEPYGMEAGSTYQTDISYPLGVCLFSSLTNPPFGSVTRRGGFYGHGFLHYQSGGNLLAATSAARKIRTDGTAGMGALMYNYSSNIPFKSLQHTLTICQGRTGAGNKAMCLTQGDFNAFEDYTADNVEAAIVRIGQVEDQTFGFTINSSDTVKIGVMFNLFIDAGFGGVNPSPVKSWDFNLKWRKLLSV